MKKKIVVSGFPTAGKTSVGEVLKKDYGLSVSDLDQLIESREKQTIKNLIREEGEDAFRDCESKALENALTAKETEVLTIGGGALLRESNRLLLKNCLHISLDIMPSVAAIRAFNDEEAARKCDKFPLRPLLSLVDEDFSFQNIAANVERLYGERKDLLDLADFRINTSWVAANQVAQIVFGLSQLGDIDQLKKSVLIPISLRGDECFELIVIGCGVSRAISDFERLLKLSSGRKVFVVDENVKKAGKLSLPSSKSLENKLLDVASGEKSKSLSEVSRLCEELAKFKLRRTDEVVAIGGGVVGDLAGLVASLYMRGVSLIHVPTTIVAQVDSSIGGKTGVNLESGKNLVGTFEPARLIISDIELLSTLPEREFKAGLAEVIKYGLIRSNEFFDWVEENEALIKARDAKTLLRMIESSSLFKLDFVHGDIRDVSGQRAQLNFGHTVGHAIEKLSGYGELLHGEAVAIGMVVACSLGEELGVTPKDIRPKLVNLLKCFELPVSVSQELLGFTEPKKFSEQEFLESDLGKRWVNVLQLDKKRTESSANFVLLTKLGAATCLDVRLEAILRAVFVNSTIG